MSANDELPWTQPVLALMRDAARRRVPMIGHCLGGQLLSRALGGRVIAQSREGDRLGSGARRATRRSRANGSASGPREFDSFQWHGTPSRMPDRAPSASCRAQHCANQAYVADGLHLGMQCHVEMTPEMIASWIESGARELDESRASPAVQSAARIAEEASRRLPALGAIADRLYARWLRNLAP